MHMNSNTFEDFDLNPAVLRAIREEGYRTPTPIQSAAIPVILEGRDLIGTAQTGTGKTAAFCLPMLDRLHKNSGGGLRALVLTPTRELALQIDASLRTYGRHLPLRSAVVLGGVSMHGQVQALRRRPDILVATPGRLLDLMRQKHVNLDAVEVLVLDEADRMLDMGFIRDVRAIVAKVGARRQTLLFSATLPPEIRKLASDILTRPASVEAGPASTVALKVDQKVLFVDQADKGSLLVDILEGSDVRRALVFTRTKHRADRVVRQLSRSHITADAIHSNKSQNNRQRSLAAFDRGQIRVLVATDIMARGIDVEGISHVINYELPNEAASYIHRVGRTARAGATGIALSFCDASETAMLRDIEKLIRYELPAVEGHPFHSASVRSLRGHRPPAARPGPAPRRSPGFPEAHARRRNRARA
jgi:ATP-dependent RNA helicase RhlE